MSESKIKLRDLRRAIEDYQSWKNILWMRATDKDLAKYEIERNKRHVP